MTTLPPSPRITHLSWGHLEVEGQPRAFKDAKLFPGGAKEWDWRETGTQNVPGIQSADVEELIQHGAEVVVLSKGMEVQLRVCPETVKYLEKQGVETHILPSKEAVRLYNELRSRAPVGALIHSTC
jgi:hypothetical protein